MEDEPQDASSVDDTSNSASGDIDSMEPTSEVMPEDVEDEMQPTQVEPAARVAELPLGEANDFARMGCELLDGEATPVIAVDMESAAGQVLLLPSETDSYAIRLPDEGPGFVTMEVPEWAAEISVHVDATTRYEVLGAEVMVLTELQANPYCADRGITHRGFHFHSWGAFTIKFEADGPREAKVALVLTDPGG